MYPIEIINDNASFTSTIVSIDNPPPLQRLSKWVTRRISKRNLSSESNHDAERASEEDDKEEQYIRESYAAFCLAFTASGQPSQQNKEYSMTMTMDDADSGTPPKSNLLSTSPSTKPDQKLYPADQVLPPPDILTPSLYAQQQSARSKLKRQWSQVFWEPIRPWFFKQ